MDKLRLVGFIHLSQPKAAHIVMVQQVVLGLSRNYRKSKILLNLWKPINLINFWGEIVINLGFLGRWVK